MDDNRGHWAIGLAIVLGGFALYAGVLLVRAQFVESSGGVSSVFDFLFAAPGVGQLAWVVPAGIWAGTTGRRSTLVGLLVTAGIVLLLNGACWGTVTVLN